VTPSARGKMKKALLAILFILFTIKLFSQNDIHQLSQRPEYINCEKTQNINKYEINREHLMNYLLIDTELSLGEIKKDLINKFGKTIHESINKNIISLYFQNAQYILYIQNQNVYIASIKINQNTNNNEINKLLDLSINEIKDIYGQLNVDNNYLLFLSPINNNIIEHGLFMNMKNKVLVFNLAIE
jgi:hypothetical protein